MPTKVAKIFKFYTDTCVPCKRLSAAIAESAYRDMIVEINASKCERNQLIEYGVKAVPTLVFLDEHDNVLGSRTGDMRTVDFDKAVEGYI